MASLGIHPGESSAVDLPKMEVHFNGITTMNGALGAIPVLVSMSMIQYLKVNQDRIKIILTPLRSVAKILIQECNVKPIA